MKKSNIIIYSVLGLIAVGLLVVNITRVSTNQLTFTSFLTYISNAPRVFIDFSISDFTIVSSWGPFNGFRDFLNIFTSSFGFIVFLGKSLVNMVVYILYFVFLLF